MTNKYDDIIHLPRHMSTTRETMPIRDRAAQFSPFAALTGHDAAIKETARLTEERIELDTYIKDGLNKKLQVLIKYIGQSPKITVTYFQSDKMKDGGTYITLTGKVKKINEYKKIIILEDNTKISMNEIVDIQGKIFDAVCGG